MTNPRCNSLRAATWMVFALLLSCSAAPEQTPEEIRALRERNVGIRKRRMLMATEGAIRKLMAQATAEIKEVRQSYEIELLEPPTVPRLNVVDAYLETYAGDQWQEFSTFVRSLEEETVSTLEGILARYDEAFWTVAEEAGRLEHGSGFGFRTGYQELDDKVEAASAQLAGRADVEGVRQLATFRSTERVVLNRDIRHIIPDSVTFLLFVSAPESLHRLPTKDDVARQMSRKVLHQSVAQAAALIKEPGMVDIDMRIIQAVRYRIERSGIVLIETPWRFDPAQGPEGVMPVLTSEEFPEYLVTETLVPGARVNADGFSELRSHTIVAEYRTALERLDTQEIMCTIAWQVSWGVDYRGQTRVLTEQSYERVVEDDQVIGSLRQAALEPVNPETTDISEQALEMPTTLPTPSESEMN